MRGGGREGKATCNVDLGIGKHTCVKGQLKDLKTHLDPNCQIFFFLEREGEGGAGDRKRVTIVRISQIVNSARGRSCTFTDMGNYKIMESQYLLMTNFAGVYSFEGEPLPY